MAQLLKLTKDCQYFKREAFMLFLISCSVTLVVVVVSVTRFGKISPLWHNFKSIGQIFASLFSIWQNVNLTLAKNVMLLGKFSLLSIATYFKII